MNQNIDCLYGCVEIDPIEEHFIFLVYFTALFNKKIVCNFM